MTTDQAIDALLGLPDLAARRHTLPYERLSEGKLREAIRLFKHEALLVRRPFGWHLDGTHLPNMAEHFDMASVVAAHRWTLVCDFGRHIAIVRTDR